MKIADLSKLEPGTYVALRSPSPHSSALRCGCFVSFDAKHKRVNVGIERSGDFWYRDTVPINQVTGLWTDEHSRAVATREAQLVELREHRETAHKAGQEAARRLYDACLRHGIQVRVDNLSSDVGLNLTNANANTLAALLEGLPSSS